VKPAKYEWKFVNEKDFQGFVLYENVKEHYSVDLGSCGTSAQVLDWIFQVWEKTWVKKNPEIIVGLIELIGKTLKPQATLCSNGIELGPVDWRVVIPKTKKL
jgi:hypothetical protein